MNRIDPNEVREAFERLGAEPVRGIWHRERDGRLGLCALSALYQIENGDVLDKRSEEIKRFVEEAYGLDRVYLRGFILGYDFMDFVEEDPAYPQVASAFTEEDMEKISTGIEDGKRVRMALAGAL